MMRMFLGSLLAATWLSGANAQTPLPSVMKNDLSGSSAALLDLQRAVATIQPGQSIAPLARVTLFVRNMDNSLKLYRDILGLKQKGKFHWKGERLNAFIKGEGTEIDAVELGAGDSTVGNLTLYQITDKLGEPAPAATEKYGHTGDFAVVFSTRDIKGIHERARQAGYVIFAPPVTLMSRPDMKEQPLEMSLRDPDGFMVNLTQAGVPK